MTLTEQIRDLVAEIRREQSDPRRTLELSNVLQQLVPLAERAAATIDEMARQSEEKKRKHWFSK